MSYNEKSQNLFEEYKIAHEELMSLYSIFWRQLQFFLTLNSTLIIAVSIFKSIFSIMNVLISIFGIIICILWVFHGNRLYSLIQIIEEKLRESENDEQFIMKLKKHQYQILNKRDLPLFQRIPGQTIRNTILPFIMGLIWAIMFVITLL